MLPEPPPKQPPKKPTHIVKDCSDQQKNYYFVNFMAWIIGISGFNSTVMKFDHNLIISLFLDPLSLFQLLYHGNNIENP